MWEKTFLSVKCRVKSFFVIKKFSIKARKHNDFDTTHCKTRTLWKSCRLIRKFSYFSTLHFRGCFCKTQLPKVRNNLLQEMVLYCYIYILNNHCYVFEFFIYYMDIQDVYNVFWDVYCTVARAAQACTFLSFNRFQCNHKTIKLSKLELEQKLTQVFILFFLLYTCFFINLLCHTGPYL